MNFLALIADFDGIDVADLVEFEIGQARETVEHPLWDFTDSWLLTLLPSPEVLIESKTFVFTRRHEAIQEALSRIYTGTRRRYVGEDRDAYLARVLDSVEADERKKLRRKIRQLAKNRLLPELEPVPRFTEDGEGGGVWTPDAIDRLAESAERLAQRREFLARLSPAHRAVLEARAAAADGDRGAVGRLRIPRRMRDRISRELREAARDSF